MTVNAGTITSGPYTGNGATSQFSYGFTAATKDDLVVYETDNSGATPVVTLLVVDTDYTVNDVGVDGGGTIDRVAGNLPTGDIWYIKAAYDDLQDVDFASQGGFFPETHEDAFDRRTFVSLQQQDLIERSIRFPDSYSGTADLELPLPEADKTILWNATGDGLVNGPTVGTFAGYASAAEAAAVAAAASEAAAAISETNADNDATATAADAVQTALDKIATNADVVITNGDVVITQADAILTAADVVSAEAAKDAAEAAQAAAEAVFDQFDDVYLGAKASDPTLDNDGNALQSGAMYFNTTTLLLNVYDLAGTTWIPLPVTALGSLTDVVLTSIASGELLMWNGTVWINQTLTEQDIATITLTLARDSATGAGNLPVGTTAQRPAGSNGLIRYNSTLGVFEGYSGSAWGTLGGGATGGGANTVFVENDQNVTDDYTIPATKNAMSTGPITIDSGVTVTVSAGARWVIL